MKKKMFFLVLVFCMGFSVNAQRHIRGIKGIDLMGGITGKGIYGELGYNKYLTNKIFYNMPLRYEYATIDKMKISSFSFNPNMNYTVFKPWKWFFLSAKAGGSFYLDYISDNLPPNKDYISSNGVKFNYGLFLGLESEIFISDRFAWILNFRQNYNFHPVSGNWVFYGGTGIRYNIY